MEQRRHPRLESRAVVEVEGETPDLLDLSCGGMCLKTRLELPPGRLLPFVVSLPGGDSFSGTARVRWAHRLGWGHAHGLEIVQLDWSARRRLSKHLFPRQFGLLEFLDVALQFSCATVAVLLTRELLARDAALAEALAQSLPALFLAAGAATGLWALARR